MVESREERAIPIVTQFSDGKESSTGYAEEIEKICESNKTYYDKVGLFDLIFRDFLGKKFHVRKDEEYSELISFFIEKNKPEIASFCHGMIESIYSGEKLDETKIRVMADDL